MLPRTAHLFNFIIAAPQRKAGVGTHARHISGNFTLDIFQKTFLEKRITLAGKRKVLPDKDTHFIAFFQKRIIRVITAAPYAQQIHMGKAHGSKKLLPLLCIKAVDELVGRDDISTLGKKRYAV